MHRESFLPLRAAAFRGRSYAPTVRPSPAPDAPPRPIGVERVDAWLGGGVRGDGLHELFAGTTDDLASTLGFATLLARLGGGEAASLLWLRRPSKLMPYGPGLVAMGLDPDAATLVQLTESRDLLRATLDAVRTGAAATVLLEMTGRQPLLDLTATRRLVLAAARTGTLVLIVRADAEPGLSAAHSRWRIRSAPSTPLIAEAPGAPVFDLTLLRQRGGREGLNILLEWNRDTASFREWEEPRRTAPLSGGMAAMASGGERTATQDRAA